MALQWFDIAAIRGMALNGASVAEIYMATEYDESDIIKVVEEFKKELGNG